MDKGLSVAAIWLAPALACWATGSAYVAIAFIASLLTTCIIYPPHR